MVWPPADRHTAQTSWSRPVRFHLVKFPYNQNWNQTVPDDGPGSQRSLFFWFFCLFFILWSSQTLWLYLNPVQRIGVNVWFGIGEKRRTDVEIIHKHWDTGPALQNAHRIRSHHHSALAADFFLLYGPYWTLTGPDLTPPDPTGPWLDLTRPDQTLTDPDWPTLLLGPK